MGKAKFGSLGDEREILEIIRRMSDAGDKPTQILRSLTDAGYTARSGKPFTRQGVQSLVIDLDRARRVKLDLRQRSSRLSESLAEVEALSATDSSCAKINARVQTLQAGSRPSRKPSRSKPQTDRQTDLRNSEAARTGRFLLCASARFKSPLR